MKQHFFNILTITFLATGLYFILYGNLVYAIISLIVAYVFSVYAFRTFIENIKREIVAELANKFVTEMKNIMTPQTIASFITSVLFAINVSQSQSGNRERWSDARNRADRTGANANTAGSEADDRQNRSVSSAPKISSNGA